MKKLHFRQHKKINDLLFGFSTEQLAIFDQIFYALIDQLDYSLSAKYRKSQCLVEIIKNNDTNHEELYLEYFSTKNTKRKLEIKYGRHRVSEYENKLSNRNRPSIPHSIFDYNFWMKRGYTETVAKEKVSTIQRANVEKRTTQSYNMHSKKLKYSIDYWTNIGYTEQEAELLRQPFLQKVKNNLECLIEKYGCEEGTERWIKRCAKYKEAMRINLPNRRTGGFVSKESLTFFVPLYKFCRKLGLKRSDIYFGISGSREFFIKDGSQEHNTGKFYDFCIHKLSLIIEYHGTFWHPKSADKWDNPWTNFQEAYDNDEYKKNLALKRNMSYEVVWSDDNLKRRYVELTEMIKRKYHEL